MQTPDVWGTVAAMAATPRTETAIPAWIESDLLVVNGRDPLGLDAIATYRIMPTALNFLDLRLFWVDLTALS